MQLLAAQRGGLLGGLERGAALGHEAQQAGQRLGRLQRAALGGPDGGLARRVHAAGLAEVDEEVRAEPRKRDELVAVGHGARAGDVGREPRAPEARLDAACFKRLAGGHGRAQLEEAVGRAAAHAGASRPRRIISPAATATAGPRKGDKKREGLSERSQFAPTPEGRLGLDHAAGAVAALPPPTSTSRRT